MDEPCSALDPIATARIEDLMQELVVRLHDRDRDPQHAAGGPRLGPDGVLHGRGRARTASGPGTVVEFDATETIFTNPSDQRTEDYVTGRFG